MTLRGIVSAALHWSLALDLHLDVQHAHKEVIGVVRLNLLLRAAGAGHRVSPAVLAVLRPALGDLSHELVLQLVHRASLAGDLGLGAEIRSGQTRHRPGSQPPGTGQKAFK